MGDGRHAVARWGVMQSKLAAMLPARRHPCTTMPLPLLLLLGTASAWLGPECMPSETLRRGYDPLYSDAFVASSPEQCDPAGRARIFHNVSITGKSTRHEDIVSETTTYNSMREFRDLDEMRLKTVYPNSRANPARSITADFGVGFAAGIRSTGFLAAARELTEPCLPSPPKEGAPEDGVEVANGRFTTGTAAMCAKDGTCLVGGTWTSRTGPNRDDPFHRDHPTRAPPTTEFKAAPRGATGAQPFQSPCVRSQ